MIESRFLTVLFLALQTSLLSTYALADLEDDSPVICDLLEDQSNFNVGQDEPSEETVEACSEEEGGDDLGRNSGIETLSEGFGGSPAVLEMGLSIRLQNCLINGACKVCRTGAGALRGVGRCLGRMGRIAGAVANIGIIFDPKLTGPQKCFAIVLNKVTFWTCNVENGVVTFDPGFIKPVPLFDAPFYKKAKK